MSALGFKPHCSNCFSDIRPGTGAVLSCCCFLCEDCSIKVVDQQCPNCRQPVAIAYLSQAPTEVAAKLSDPGQVFEELFEQLKFQTAHYLSIIQKASTQIRSLQKELVASQSRVRSYEEQSHQSLPAKRSRIEDESPFFDNKRPNTGTGSVSWQSGAQRDRVVIAASLPQATPPASTPITRPPTASASLTRTPLLHNQAPKASSIPSSLVRQPTTAPLPQRLSTPNRPASQQQQRLSTPNSAAIYRPGSGQSNPVSTGPARLRSPQTPIMTRPATTASPYFGIGAASKSVTIQRYPALSSSRDSGS